MPTAILTLDIKPEMENEFLRIIGEMILDTRANEPDTLVYHLAREQQSGRYRMLEVYASEEAEKAHAKRDFIRHRARALGPCLAEPVAVERLQGIL